MLCPASAPTAHKAASTASAAAFAAIPLVFPYTSPSPAPSHSQPQLLLLLLLLPAGLRPVKDVLFGAREVAAWHAREPRLCLRIVGPELDAAYAAQVRAQLLELGSPRGVAYVGALPQRELHAAMGQARTADLDPPSCASSMTALRGRPPVILHH